MIAQCPTCQTKYKVADEKVSPGGTKFKCKKCKSAFTVYKDLEQRRPEDAEYRAPVTKTCPHCGKPVPIQAVKCRWCRQPLTAATAASEEGEGYEGQEAYTSDEEHQDPFAPQGAGGYGEEYQDPFVPQDTGANAFEENEGGFGGAAPGYGGPPPPGGGGHQGGYTYHQAAMPAGGVPTYLAQSILVTLLCCLPFGIVAIVYAAQVNGKLAAGDIPGAIDSSGKAKLWSWISFGVGLGITLLYLIAGIFGAAVQQH